MGGDLGSFHGEFLVVGAAFDADRSNWEMHPNAGEIVCLLSGAVTFLLDEENGTNPITLTVSEDCLVAPKGAWHTARAQTRSRMFFIKPGEGTRHRPTR